MFTTEKEREIFLKFLAAIREDDKTLASGLICEASQTPDLVEPNDITIDYRLTEGMQVYRVNNAAGSEYVEIKTTNADRDGQIQFFEGNNVLTGLIEFCDLKFHGRAEKWSIDGKMLQYSIYNHGELMT